MTMECNTIDTTGTDDGCCEEAEDWELCERCAAREGIYGMGMCVDDWL